MESFYATIGIVFGILLPIIIVLSVLAAIYCARIIILSLGIKLEELKLSRPYDNVETYHNINTDNIHVRFYRKELVIWEGLVDVVDN